MDGNAPAPVNPWREQVEFAINEMLDWNPTLSWLNLTTRANTLTMTSFMAILEGDVGEGLGVTTYTVTVISRYLTKRWPEEIAFWLGCRGEEYSLHTRLSDPNKEDPLVAKVKLFATLVFGRLFIIQQTT